MSCQLITVLFVFQGPCWGVTSTVLMEPAPALLVSTTALAGGRGGPAQESRDKEGPRLQEKKTPGPEFFLSVATIGVELKAQRILDRLLEVKIQVFPVEQDLWLGSEEWECISCCTDSHIYFPYRHTCRQSHSDVHLEISRREMCTGCTHL